MKKILLTTLMVSATFAFVGCSGANTKEPVDSSITLNDSSIEDSFEYPDNSVIKEFDDISDGNFDIGTSDESSDTSNKSESNKGVISYGAKTVNLEGGATVSIPSDWTELELNSSIFYVFDNDECVANFVVEDMQGLSSEKYMELAEKSVKEYLDVNTVNYSSKTVNGVKVDIFEYVQNSAGTPLYTYQPTIFKDGKAYILTLGSQNKSSLETSKALGCEVITTVK